MELEMTFPASDPPASTKPGSGVTGPCNAADTQRTQITVLRLKTDIVITLERPGARSKRMTRMSRAVTPSSASEVAIWSTSSCVGFAHDEEPAPKLGGVL